MYFNLIQCNKSHPLEFVQFRKFGIGVWARDGLLLAQQASEVCDEIFKKRKRKKKRKILKFVIFCFSLFKSPECGNMFVEEGEECDCGLPGRCDNPCCNPLTCKLHVNATCATGDCCDTAVVRFRIWICLAINIKSLFVYLDLSREKCRHCVSFISPGMWPPRILYW